MSAAVAAESDDRRSLWRRRGRILGPEMLPGSYQMTQVPTAWPLRNGLLRIAFSGRDERNRGQMLAVDVDPDASMRIVQEHYQPLVALQDCPAFAKDGIGPGDAQMVDGRLYLYGTSLDLDVHPYDMSIVLMISDDEGLSFETPREVLSSAANNGYPVALPAVRRSASGWQLWYTAFEQWLLDAQPHPDASYQIRHARSADGLVWTPDQAIAVGFASDAEAGMARPTLLSGDDGLEMWFSVRGVYSLQDPTRRYYRLAYAASDNGQEWQRRDRAQRFLNPPQPGDWDYEMQCYPQVLAAADGRTYLFYCGNWYGNGGIGFAERLPPESHSNGM